MTTWSKCWFKFCMRMMVVTVFMVWAYNNLSTPTPPVRPQAVGSPAELASRMDCWQSGEHGIPTNVVYRIGGDWKMGGKKAVDMAFAQIFDGADNGMTVYAFCK